MMEKPIIEKQTFESGSYTLKQNREIKTKEDIEEFKEILSQNRENGK